MLRGMPEGGTFLRRFHALLMCCGGRSAQVARKKSRLTENWLE